MAQRWPGCGWPFVLLSWLAHDVISRGINPGHLEAGRVGVNSRVARPVARRQRIEGSFLFLGIVARGLDCGGWTCRLRAAHPLARNPDAGGFR